MFHRASGGTLAHALMANTAGRQGDQHPGDQKDPAQCFDNEGHVQRILPSFNKFQWASSPIML